MVSRPFRKGWYPIPPRILVDPFAKVAGLLDHHFNANAVFLCAAKAALDAVRTFFTLLDTLTGTVISRIVVNKTVA